MYNYGTGTDRALGSYRQFEDVTFALVLQNQTSSTFESITLSYWGEQWWLPVSAKSKLDFSYAETSSLNLASGNANSFVPYASNNPSSTRFFDGYSNPANNLMDATLLSAGTGQTLPVDGNNSAYRRQYSSTLPVSWAPGEYIILRWFDDAGSNEANDPTKLAIDDLQFQATVPEPSSFLLCILAALIVAGTIHSKHINRRQTGKGS